MIKKITLLGVLGLPCPNTNYIQGIKQIHQAITIVPKLNYKAKFYSGGILLWCLLFSASIALAQQNKPLRVGDKLPESFWQQEHTVYANGKTTIQTLEQYKGKLLILDFWATWCGSCVQKFSLLDSLQRAYPDKLAIVLVNSKKTGGNLSKIEQSLSRYVEKHAFGLPTIYNDEYLKATFPHFLVSHFVWINADAQIMAITWADLVNAQSIAMTLNHR